MEGLEESTISMYILHFLNRYDDSCITTIPKDSHVRRKQHFHRYHEWLKFTVEIEKEQNIYFLTKHYITKINKWKLYGIKVDLIGKILTL